MPEAADHESDGYKNRRGFLKVAGLLGVTGLAGCGGNDDSTADETPTESPSETAASTTIDTESPTGTRTETEADTPTDTATRTATPQGRLPDDPAPLFSFDGSSSERLAVSPDAATLTGTFENSYLFEVTSGEVTIEAPSEEWSITPANGTTFDSLAQQESRDVAWDITVPNVAQTEFTLTATVTYTGPNGVDQANVTVTQTVLVDPYEGQPWQDLAIAPDYYDGLSEDQDAPGELPGDHIDSSLGVPPLIEIELDLSDWADARNFQLKFGDYWTSDGWGTWLERTQVVADGEVTLDFEADSEDEQEYIVTDQGSVRGSNAFDEDPPVSRFADATSFWVYQLPVPEDTSDLAVVLTIANGFDVDGIRGLER
jgi:hypothetical protein